MKYSQKQIETMTPMFSNILVRMIEPERKTAGGIIKPDELVDKESFGAHTAVIVEMGEHAFQVVGADTNRTPKSGDTVLVASYAGKAHKVGEIHYRLLQDADVLAILGDE